MVNIDNRFLDEIRKYNSAGRLTYYESASGVSIWYQYNKNNKLISYKKWDGGKLFFVKI